MKGKYKKKGTLVILGTILVLGLSMMGISYAAWNDVTDIKVSFTTGIFDAVFVDNKDCQVCIVEISKNNKIEKLQEADSEKINFTLSSDKKRAEIAVNQSLFANMLADTDRFLIIKYPFGVSEVSTVNAPKAFNADFTAESNELLEASPGKMSILLDGEEYLCPEEARTALSTPLSFHVYRQVEIIEDMPVYMVLLKLTEESRALLDEPLQIEANYEDLDETMRQYIESTGAEDLYQSNISVNIDYEFSFPLFIDQFNGNDESF